LHQENNKEEIKMTRLKKLAVLGAVVTAISATTITAYAASNYSTPAEALAGLTGKTTEDILSERTETGKTYGTIAYEEGKLEEFKDEMLQIKKDILDQRVKDGTMTQEEADAALKTIEERLELCDGTGSGRQNGGCGLGFGFGRQGSGSGLGMGRMNGAGRGCWN
jgi:hypothetical protein